MENTEMQNIWQAYDQKMQGLLRVNKDIAIQLSKQAFDKELNRLYRPKRTAMLIGIPYTILLLAITIVASFSKAYFVAFGFGSIATIMLLTLIIYTYQLSLIKQITASEKVLSTQESLSTLRISSYNCLCLAIFQLPFWSICWMSITALKESPWVYGGIHLVIFLILSYTSYWVFKKLNYNNKKSKFRAFFLSGNEWDPINKASDILAQIKEYENIK